MKKSKVIIAVALAVVLLVTMMNAPTFSWFTRPKNHTGERMILTTKNVYTAFNGYNVNPSTYKSNNGTGFSGTYTVECNTDNACDGSGVSPYTRNYFCTTLTNTSGTAQNVSLYARTLSIPTADSNGKLALGVNYPTRSYRDYTSLADQSKMTDRDMMRIYFEKDNGVQGWGGTEFYICWNDNANTSSETLGNKGQNGKYQKLLHVGGNNNPNQYFADIPKTATHAFFAVENWGTNNNGSENWGQRSQELCNLASDGQSQTNSMLFKITSSTNSNNNHLVTSYNNITGNCIRHYYSTIFVAMGNTFNASDGVLYIGGSLRYYSGDTSVFTVNETTGEITPVAAGEATLYTKSTGGSYPDEQQVETTVRVTADANYVFNDVPIVKNVIVPASTGEEGSNQVKVYWYVLNNSPTNNLSYAIDNVYVGL